MSTKSVGSNGRRWLGTAVLVLGLLALAVFLQPAAPVAAVVPGANGKIAFTHYVTSSSLIGDIYVMDADGSNPVQVTSLPGLEQGAAWSPDGRTIAFSTYDGVNTAVYLVDADGSNLRLLVTDGQWPTWSPDGSKLALMRCLFCEDIWVVNVDGTGLTRLTTNAEREMWPDWSPDGTKIVYHRNNSAQIGDIWVMNADGSGQTNLTNSAANDAYAKWSPDGAKITFTSDFDIWVMHANGSSPVNLTSHPALDQYSSWSPDGAKILFESRRTGVNQVYVMTSSGGNLAALTTTADHNASAAWQRIAPPVPLSIEQIARFETPKIVAGLAVDGDYAYLGNDSAGLRVINVADPETPTEVGSLDTPNSAGGVAIEGDYAFVGDGYGDLRIANIADPSAPTETSHLGMPGFCCGMEIVGDYLYAATGPEGLHIINIADKGAPFEVGSADTPDWAHSVAVNGDYAYIGDGQDMRILSVADKTSPVSVGYVDTPGFARHVILVGRHLYLADGYGGLRIFNTTNPAAPVEVASVGSLGYATGVAVEGDLAFVTGFYGQVSVINVATPSAPVKVASLQTSARLNGLAVAGDTVYVAAYEGLLIFRVSPSACPAVPGNLLQNYCFEEGTSPWVFWTDGAGTYLASSADPYQGRFAADVSIAQEGSNVQFYQKKIALKPNTKYELSFAAYSSNGSDLSVYLQKHDAPYTNYGLNNFFVDLSSGWQVYSTTFTTKGFAAPVDDARLRFWLAPYDADNMTYHIDWAVLREVNAANPPIPSDPPVLVPPPGQCNPPIAGNLIANPGFEDGKTAWAFYTDGAGSFATASVDPYECAKNAKVSIATQGSNVQLYQKDIAVQGGTPYLLRLAARSSGGQDVSLYLHKQSAPYTNYGLNGVQLNLTPDWQVFVVEFTAIGSVPLTDARLRLWLAPFDQNEASYEFDDVVLLPKSAAAALAAPQITESALGSAGAKAGATGVAANSVQVQGYFLDGDEDGRLAGAYVPDNGAGWCYAARPSLSALLPADGKLVRVTLPGLGSPRSVVITGIRQNEPVGPEPDGYGLGTAVATLRRERDAAGEGRVYHIAFTATYRGVACSHEVVVTVPVDRHTPAADSGVTYDSTVATE